MTVELDTGDDFVVQKHQLANRIAEPCSSCVRLASHLECAGGRQHQGVDMAAPQGTAVVAAGARTAEFTMSNAGGTQSG